VLREGVELDFKLQLNKLNGRGSRRGAIVSSALGRIVWERQSSFERFGCSKNPHAAADQKRRNFNGAISLIWSFQNKSVFGTAEMCAS
jgi:hypothetical protein